MTMQTNAATLAPAMRALLDEGPALLYYVAIGVEKDKGFKEASALGLKKYSVFDFSGIVFTQARASDILIWSERSEILTIEVIDDTAAYTFFRVMNQLQAVARYDNLGIFRPNVVNISLGPVRALVGKDASGEAAIRTTLNEIVATHHIPVVMSAGNDGPDAGTVNPWSIGTDVFVVGATNAAGTEVYARSSRFDAPVPSHPAFFVAEGIDTLGPRAGCRPKSLEELEQDRKGNLAARIGNKNKACWELKSGTSFSAGIVTQTLCLLHQGLWALRLMMDPATSKDGRVELPIFIRAYIDFDFDRDLDVFHDRLVDDRQHFGPLTVTFPVDARQTYLDVIRDTSVDLRLVYEPDTILPLLKFFAKAVPAQGPETVGFGFLNFDNVATGLRTMRMSDLVKALGPHDLRESMWLKRIESAGDPQVFPEQVVDDIKQYCVNNDLILELPLK